MSFALLEEPGTGRDPVTARILDAALAELGDHGLRRVSVEDIRRRAKVDRTTVYRRFGTKDELIAAALQRWILRVLREIAAEVANRPTVGERLVEGFVRAVLLVRTDSLIGRLLRSEPETFLPHLTTEGAPILRACREFLVAQCRALRPDFEADAAAEIALRLAQSAVLTPDGWSDLRDEAALRAFATRYLGPLTR